MPTDRFSLLTDTAIELIADLGMRGLTHRAVDTRAGLAQGTTSAYFRTRKALIEAVVRRLAELDRADLAAGALPADADSPSVVLDDVDMDAVAAAIAGVLDRWMSTARSRTLARYWCLLEATHHRELRTILAHGDVMRAQAAAMLTGAPDPERAGRHLVACIDGLLFDRLVGAGSRAAPAPGTAESRADLTVAIATLLRGFGEQPTAAN